MKSAALYTLAVAHLIMPDKKLPYSSQQQANASNYQQPLEKQQESDEHAQQVKQEINALKASNQTLTQKNAHLKTQLKTIHWNNTMRYGLLGATIMVSTFAMHGALGFIEPQHTSSYWGIAADAFMAASCGYVWSLVGYMHNPKSLRDEKNYRSKIIPSYAATVGGLSTTIALGNAFVTTKGYNHALICGGIMMITPLVVSAGWHWWQCAKEQHA